MASTTKHTIMIEVNGTHRPIQEKVVSGNAITPGMLIEHDGAAVDVHGVANGVNQKMVAVENPYDDNNAVEAIDSPWAIGDSARFIYAQPGDLLYMFLDSGENVAAGATLGSAGNGNLQAVTIDATILANAPVAVAEEAVNATAATARILVRML